MASALTKKAAPDSKRDPVILAHKFSQSLNLQKPIFTLHTGTHHNEESKRVSIRFPEALVKKWGHLELIHITDVQYGHVLCKQKRIREFRDWILAAPNRFALFGGDNIDAWRLGSPGSPYENVGDPQSQVRGFCLEFAPIAHRILGYVGGNHERRATIGFGDLGSLISSILRIPYSAGQQFIDIYWGDWKPFAIDLWHGRGAARTKGAKINMLFDFMRKSDAHLCLVGHLHDPISTFRWIRSRDTANLALRFEKQGGAMSSSFLEWVGSYAEVADLEATDCMMACAIIEPNRHWTLSLR